MNTEQASPDRPDVEPDDGDTDALQRSQDAIDEGHEAAREALQDNPPDAESSEPSRTD
jgi:hypothetical protein